MKNMKKNFLLVRSELLFDWIYYNIGEDRRNAARGTRVVCDVYTRFESVVILLFYDATCEKQI